MINLVVGNLPPAVTVPQLVAFFGAYGTVERVQLGRNHLTGREEPFCYLDLRESSQRPSPTDELDLWGHALTIRAASSPSGWAIGR